MKRKPNLPAREQSVKVKTSLPKRREKGLRARSITLSFFSSFFVEFPFVVRGIKTQHSQTMTTIEAAIPMWTMSFARALSLSLGSAHWNYIYSKSHEHSQLAHLSFFFSFSLDNDISDNRYCSPRPTHQSREREWNSIRKNFKVRRH